MNAEETVTGEEYAAIIAKIFDDDPELYNYLLYHESDDACL